ncbi:AI-2E family transporter [Kitasatospora herbaricolor]|uniref:AI-2E family transporter n=1 Tax=Kitasatospora herbaricolor TaxID=68217 RepID=UPI0036DCE88F
MTDRPPQRAAALSQPTRVLLTLAAAGVAAWAISAGRGLLAPLLLGAILVIVAHPVRRPLDRRGVPRWLGTTVVIAIAYAVLIGLAVIVGLALVQFGHVLTDYGDELKQSSDQVAAFFGGLGLDGSALRPDALLPLLLNAGTSLLGLGTAIFFVLAYVIYLAVDAARFRDIPAEVAASHAMRIRTFRDFADGTSRYYLVNSIFGLIVAVIDGLALWALGIPAPFAWAVLAFVTNYIPNIGFVIGLIPPVVLAIVTGGWALGLLVVAIYCAVNVVLQVLVQPRFVSKTVRLSITLTFFSVVLWTVLLGPIGAILAVPLSLLLRFLLLGAAPDARLARWLTGDDEHLVDPEGAG